MDRRNYTSDILDSFMLLSLKKLTKELLQSQTLQEHGGRPSKSFADSGGGKAIRCLKEDNFRQNRNSAICYLQPTQPAIARAVFLVRHQYVAKSMATDATQQAAGKINRRV